MCSFWDWEKGERLDYFYNGNPRYTRITSMEYLNGHDCSLLLTATGLFTYQSCWHGLRMVLIFVCFCADFHHATFLQMTEHCEFGRTLLTRGIQRWSQHGRGCPTCCPPHEVCFHTYKHCADTTLLLSSEFLFPIYLHTSYTSLASVWKNLSVFPVFLHDAGAGL